MSDVCINDSMEYTICLVCCGYYKRAFVYRRVDKKGIKEKGRIFAFVYRHETKTGYPGQRMGVCDHLHVCNL